MTMNSPIIIAAGGTGGHFFPAEALAASLAQRGHRLVLMTDARNTRITEGAFKDCPHYILPGGGISGKTFVKKLQGGLRLLNGICKARTILSALQPSAVIGFGGYPSIPPLFGARLLLTSQRPTLIIHEGNAVLGKANALLSRFTHVVATSYPHVARLPLHTKTHLTGMPVRPPIEALADCPYNIPALDDTSSPIRILVWGGSLGAKIFSHVVPEALATLPQKLRSRLHITQQINEDDLPTLTKRYKEIGVLANLQPFIYNVADVLKETHLVIGRAGGSSAAELTMAGRPSILVPLPIAASDEQGANAHAIERAGAGWMIRQSSFTPNILADRLLTLLNDPIRLINAAAASKTLQHRHAAENLADLVEASLNT